MPWVNERLLVAQLAGTEPMVNGGYFLSNAVTVKVVMELTIPRNWGDTGKGAGST